MRVSELHQKSSQNKPRQLVVRSTIMNTDWIDQLQDEPIYYYIFYFRDENEYKKGLVLDAKTKVWIYRSKGGANYWTQAYRILANDIKTATIEALKRIENEKEAKGRTIKLSHVIRHTNSYQEFKTDKVL